jgi:hypothetical protein
MVRYKRKAAGKVFMFVFAALSNLHYQLIFNHMDWGEDIFTPKEKEVIERLKERLNAEADLCRRIGHRLIKS